MVTEANNARDAWREATDAQNDYTGGGGNTPGQGWKNITLRADDLSTLENETV
jgi:hypothetical protein